MNSTVEFNMRISIICVIVEAVKYWQMSVSYIASIVLTACRSLLYRPVGSPSTPKSEKVLIHFKDS